MIASLTRAVLMACTLALVFIITLAMLSPSSGALDFLLTCWIGFCITCITSSLFFDE